MQSNNQTPLSKSERAVWGKYVDESLDDRFREAFYKRDALPAQVRSFWHGLYSRNNFERFFNAAYSGIFIGLRRFEAVVKRKLIQPFRKKTKFRKTAPQDVTIKRETALKTTQNANDNREAPSCRQNRVEIP